MTGISPRRADFHIRLLRGMSPEAADHYLSSLGTDILRDIRSDLCIGLEGFPYHGAVFSELARRGAFDEGAAGFAAIGKGRREDDDLCFGYGDTEEECKAVAARQLQINCNLIGRRIYYDLIFMPFDADEASEISAMLDAEWIL